MSVGRETIRVFFIPQGSDHRAGEADVGAMVDAARKGTRDIER